MVGALLSIPFSVAGQTSEEKPASCEDPHIALSTYYASLNGGALSDALRLHSAAALREWKLKGVAQFKAWVAAETKNGQIKKVRLLDVVEGEKAFVNFEVIYHDGTRASRKTNLLIEKGCWKVGVIQEG